MTVYVDPMMPTMATEKWRFKYGCHLYADTLEELHEFARRLGLKRSWFQTREATGLDHYDLVVGKRRRAIQLGAQGHSLQEAAEYFVNSVKAGVVEEGMWGIVDEASRLMDASEQFAKSRVASYLRQHSTRNV